MQESDAEPTRHAPSTERLIDVAERAFAYLRSHGSASDPQRRALLTQLSRALGEATGQPERFASLVSASPRPTGWSWTEARVATLVCELDDGRGAAFDLLLAAAARERIPNKAVEAALDALLDFGVLVEPVLGRFRRA